MTEENKLKLDLGCGKNKQQGFTGVDIYKYENVDIVADLTQRWHFEDNSVDEVYCSYLTQYFTGHQRIYFFNELHRVLKPNAQARIITPHWTHEKAYGDPLVQFPPITGTSYFYLNKQWRESNAPHINYQCDFEWVLAGTHDQNDDWVAFRNQEVKQVLMTRNVNTTTELIATLTKK